MFNCSSLALRLWYTNQKIIPARNDATAKPTNIHMMAGSYAAGVRASAMADPNALVSRYIDWTKDFMDGGAFV